MPDQDRDPAQRVVFRKRRDSGDVIALFPEIPADADGAYCLSYERVGQHAGADYAGVVNCTAPASRQEYASLAAVLVPIGYRLRPQNRFSRRQHGLRRHLMRSS
jgi:hypothetical protein